MKILLDLSTIRVEDYIFYYLDDETLVYEV